MLTEDPLHPDFVALEKGDWVEILTPTSLKKAEVIDRRGYSLLVRFDATREHKAIPFAEHYFSQPVPGQWGMRKIEHKGIDAPTSHTMTVRQAAARLGVDTKTVRRMLREGALAGRQEEGKWVAVYNVTSK